MIEDQDLIRFACKVAVHPPTSDFSVFGWWRGPERPGQRTEACLEMHDLQLNQFGTWRPMREVATPGLCPDLVNFGGGRLLGDFQPMHPAFAHFGCKADDRTVVGYVVRRTVVCGVELRHSTLDGGWTRRLGFDVFDTCYLREAESALKPLAIDRNKWAVIDRLYGCGHRD